METKGLESLNKDALPKKKSYALVGVIFVLTALTAIGYYWLSKNRVSKVEPQHQKEQIRKKIIKKHTHMLTSKGQTHQYLAEKGMEDHNQEDSLLLVTPDDPGGKDMKSAEESAKETFVESNASGLVQQTVRETSTWTEPEIYPDEPDYSDAEPPEVVAVRFDPQRTPPGTNVSIYIETTDNLSGVKSISGTVQSPSQTAVLPFGCSKLDSDGLFVGLLKVPEQAEMGAWYLRSLRLTDNAHNRRSYSQDSPQLINAYFEILESDSDNVPPEIVAVYVDPSEVDGGSRVQVAVEVQDNKSGVAKIHGVFISPSKNARLPFACPSKADKNIFHGNVNIPEDAESGEWLVHYLRAEDKAKNGKTFYRTNYPNIFEGASVYVYTAGSDSQPPTLDDLMIYPPAVAYEETAEIIVYASDDTSGISRISGRLRSPSGKAHIPFSCIYNPEEQQYKAEVKIQTNTEVGLWRVDYIKMTDEARNQIVYVYQKSPLVEKAVFEIIGQ